jgi:hypothetical protein
MLEILLVVESAILGCDISLPGHELLKLHVVKHEVITFLVLSIFHQA